MQDFDFVFCVGMRRGGSTLQTQMVASLLGQPNVQLVTPETVVGFLESNQNSDAVVVAKAHKFLPEVAERSQSGRVKIVYVYRDLRDVVASIVRKYQSPPFSFVHGGLTQLLDEYQSWTSVPGIHIAKYETMIGDLASEAKRLAAFLGRELADDKAAEIASRLSVEKQREAIRKSDSRTGEAANQFDQKTLLHANHIQSGGSGNFRAILPDRVTAALEWQLRDWMMVNQYEPEFGPTRQLLSQAYFSMKSCVHGAKSLFSKPSSQ